MESLDTPTPTTQPYSDSHNSPVDPTLFNNKRDSAYSSFSASSNTSDYATVPLRPGEANSMDNLLSCQGYPVRDTSTLCESPSEGKDEAPLITQKSRSLTRPRPRPIEVKERPSSCCYEQERRGGGFEILRNGETGMERKRNPPQPPTRKDSFRATRSHPNSTNPRCASAPIESSGVSSYYEENKLSLNLESGMHNGFPAPGGGQSGNFEKDTLDTHCIQTENIRFIKCDTSAHKDYNSESTSENLSEPLTTSLNPNLPSDSDTLPAEASTEVQEQSCISHTQTKHCSTVLHRHSAPEKLLATQLQLLQFNSDSPSVEPCSLSNPSEPSLSPCSSQWSPSSLQPMSEHQEASQNHLHATSNKWGGSRCSTPGSVFFEGDGDDKDSRERLNVNGGSLTPDQHHVPWGRSVSVPGESTGSSAQERLSSEQMLEQDFEPLSAAASMDTLLDEQRAVDRGKGEEKKQEVVEGEASAKKSNSSRNHRRNRRRSERFATNLRNEIQRKKAQLQRSRGPGGLLCSRETVQEEDPDVNEEGDAEQPAQEDGAKATFATPSLPQDSQTSEPVIPSNTSSESDRDVLKTQSPSLTYPQNNSLSRSVQILDPGAPSFGVGIRVVEEPAPAGKARRWRWTPEHKLQPEPDQDRQCRVSNESVLGVTGSRHGVCAFTSSSTSTYGRSSSGSRTEDSDILPFADRMKFFEQTSKGVSVSNALGSIRSTRGGEPPNQRRYSYQGGPQESSLLSNTVEARRQSVSNSRERRKEKEREQAREREERLREREERLREREKQQEKERQERELEMERERMREMEREREREERVRQWERERELELEREKEMERARERERLQNQREKELEREREKEREEDCQLTSHQEFYRSCGFTVKTQDFQQHKENFHNFQPKPQIFSHSQTQSHVPRSAFYPVSTPSQRPENRQALPPGFSAQSYTSAEVRGMLQGSTPFFFTLPQLSEQETW